MKVELEFEGTGGGLFREIRELRDNLVEFGGVNRRVQESFRQEVTETTRTTQGLTNAVEDTTQVIASLGRTASSAGTAGLAGGLREGVTAAKELGGEVQSVKEQAKDAAKEMLKVGKSATSVGKEGAAAMALIGGAATKAAQQTGNTVRLTAEQYRKMADEALKAGVAQDELFESIADSLDEQANLNKEIQDSADILNEDTIPGMKSLTQQLREAKKEAATVAAQFGVNSEQAIAAQKRVGELANEVDNLNQRFQAFDPGKKFEAFNQLSFSLINGFSAVQGIVGVVAGENQALQQTLFAFQGILFASQGLQSFLGSFGDSLKTLRAVLLGDTVATKANTASKVENAAGSALAGGAAAGSATGFAAATASVKAFTVSLLTNPIFLLVAALAALGFALLSSGDKAEAARKKFERLREEADFLRSTTERTAEITKELALIDLEREKLNTGDSDFAKRAEQTRKAAEIELEYSKAVETARRQASNTRRRDLEELRKNGDLEQEEYDEKIKELTEFDIETNRLGTERMITRARLTNDLAALAKEEREQAKQDAAERKALQEELLAAEKDLAQKLREARRSAAEEDPFRRVELDRAAREEELRELELGFKRKIALIELQQRIGVQAFRELSDREKEARADAIIDEGNIRLPAAQQKAINDLRLLAEEQYLKELSAVYDEEAKARVEIMAEGARKESEAFAIGLEERSAALRKQGVDEKAILQFQARERERFAKEQAEKAIDLDSELQQEIIKGRQSNGDLEKVFERRKAVEILSVQIAAAQAKLGLLKDDGTQESKLRIEQARNLVRDLLRERDALVNSPVEVNLLDLLGIKEADQAAVRQALQQIDQSLQAIFSAGIQAQQAELREQISATDAIIADRQRRTDELRAQLDQELADQREGYASNVDALRQSLAQQKAEEERALERRKQLQEEQKKLARQQAIVDSATQASSLLTAGATLFKAEAFKGITGIVNSIGTIAAMIATFLAIRGRIRAATLQAFYKGTKSVRRGPGEAPGVDTVHAMLTEDEAVVPVAKNRKHRRLVEGIIDDDFSKVRAVDIAPLLKGTGIRLESEKVREVTRLGVQVAEAKAQPRSDTSALEAKVESLTGEVQRFRQQEAKRPQVTTLPDGRIMVKQGEDIHIITPRKK